MRRAAVIAMALTASAGPALGCSLSPDFKPPTALTDEEIVFVGTVTSVRWAGKTFSDRGDFDDAVALCFGRPAERDPACILNAPSTGPDTATFTVEVVGRGELGEFYEVPQGGGGDCSLGFELGRRYFFAGTFIMGMTRQVTLDEPAEAILGRYLPAE